MAAASPPPRKIHVAAAASPRYAPTDYPRGARGVAATAESPTASRAAPPPPRPPPRDDARRPRRNNKKAELSLRKDDDRKREANKEARERKEAYRYREEQVRRHMGSLKYFLLPHKRVKYYEVYPLPRKYRLLEAAEKKKKKRGGSMDD